MAGVRVNRPERRQAGSEVVDLDALVADGDPEWAVWPSVNGLDLPVLYGRTRIDGAGP